MAKRSIFARMSQLVRANVNTMIDKAEDPEKMLEQMVRDFTNNISEAESAAADVIGNLRMMEQDRDKYFSDADDWGNKALSASQKADQFRDQGKVNEADKFDNLAKIALQRQLDADNSGRSLTGTVETQRGQVDQLTNGLAQMRTKREQLVSKRDELMARTRTAEIQARVSEANKQLSGTDYGSELNRLEDNVRKLEARSMGQMELDSSASSVENDFAQLTDLGETTEIEARLIALKEHGRAALTTGKSDDEV